MKTETDTRIRLVFDSKDIEKLLPWEEFKYEQYWNYDDEIDMKTLKECMPDFDKYKLDWEWKFHNFATDWRINIENKIREWNIDWITDEIEKDLRERVGKILKEKGIEYDELEFDFYPDEIYSINLDLDYVLKRSYVNWNVVWHTNFDGFNENEVYEDEWAIKQIVDLFPDLVDKNDLERACAEWIYDGSDLKISFRHSMRDFLDIIDRWFIDLSGTNAVLHLSVNGSWSPEFTLGKWEVKFWKTYWTEFDYWDWDFDWHYWIVDVYGQVMNDNR